MFDRPLPSSPVDGSVTVAGCGTASAPTGDELLVALERLASLDGAGLDEAELLDHLAALEKLKAALAAAQARVTVTLVRARTKREAESGVPSHRRCQGLAAEIALARRESPHRGARDLGLAKALVLEMPDALDALTHGEITEWRATLLVRETAVLSRDHRSQVDHELRGRLSGMGDRAVAAAARKIGYRLDPGSALRRTRGAHADRYVSIRPAPDTMSYLTGFLPAAQGVACQTALKRHADALRAQGDTRSRGQIMADTLVERVTGQRNAESVTAEIALVMTERTLLGGAGDAAHVDGYGPIPATLARQIAREADRVWLRRLFTRPGDGSLVAMDSRQRLFRGKLRRLVVLRDQTCRTPWCDAPVRHADHIVRAADGGPTSADNGAGLCESCNYVKDTPGWRVRRTEGPRHRVAITTPTGHSYASTAPDPPGHGPPPRKQTRKLTVLFPAAPSPLESSLRRLVPA